MLKIQNIKLNCLFSDKLHIFQTVENDLIKLNVAKKGICQSMVKRDQLSSVALGSYLFLPHASSGDEHLVIQNTVLVYHLKDIMIINDSKIKVIIALALKADNQMEMIEQIGLAFSDEEQVSKIMFDKKITAQSIYDFLINS